MYRLIKRALVSVLALGCGRDEIVIGDRPSEPTLAVTPDAHAPSTGRRVVAVGVISQTWHVGSWAPASITLSSVEAGDAIVVMGAYWGDLARGSSTAPTDNHGTLRRMLDQGTVVGRSKPPVFVQLYVELDAAPGPHTIIPPYLGGPAGDGTLYVLQIRGLTERSVVAVGQNRKVHEALPGIDVALLGIARPDDLVIALAGYDNTKPTDHIGWVHPAGFTVLGSQDDAANNVPSLLCTRVAPIEAVTWSWADPTVNVAGAVIAALR